MNKKIDVNGFQQVTAKDRKIMRVQVLTSQIVACQNQLDLATQKFASAQGDFENVQDGLKVAGQALERIVSET